MNSTPLLSAMRSSSGFRLSKVELYNWGTFDGAVHGFEPRGESALLIGENGTGKSTLVDAMLTLLVRPQTRKYNFASGASKTERDERTYIQGAIDKTVNANGSAKVEYLRPGNRHYSALLASFENAATNQSFTVCQILHLDSNNKVKKFYALDSKHERSIAADLGNITEGTSILATLKKRGFQASDSYTRYFDWLKRAIGCRPKAMDMFNQAAWVKDVERLDSFVRDQMLEKKPWNDKVSKLLEHFAELNEAHRTLVSIRDQEKLLQPIVAIGNDFSELAQSLGQARLQLDATSLYFKTATVALLTPLCDQWQQRLTVLDGEIKQVDLQVQQSMRDVARLELEISGAGGKRMQELPALMETERKLAELKHGNRTQFETLLSNAQIERQVDSADALSQVLKLAGEQKTDQQKQREELQKQASGLQYEIGQNKKLLSEDTAELESLQQRKGNMPRELIFLRDQICKEFRLSSKDLPFVAELLAVDSEFRQWEASIENVLSGFGRDLLVKEKYYAKVSGFVDQTRLTDQHGRGQRLSYTKVGARVQTRTDDANDLGASSAAQRVELPQMLKYRVENELAPWVCGQIEKRFNFLACENVAQFQAADRKAMTRNRHTKRNRFHHNKDDRRQSDDRRGFILGWENREKILALKSAIGETQDRLGQQERRNRDLQTEIAAVTNTISFLDQVSQTTQFDSIDEFRHRNALSQLKLELEKLTNSNDKIRQLKTRKSELETEIHSHNVRRNELADERTRTGDELKKGRKLVDADSKALTAAEQDGSLEKCQPQFDSIETLLKESPLALDNFTTLPLNFQQGRIDEVRRLEELLTPIRGKLTKQMGRFLSKFSTYEKEMGADVDSLPQFAALHEKIQKDDLPKHEERFKKRLEENVLTEVGVMNSHLNTEHDEIKEKIEEINQGLLRMEWRDGTHVRLEPEESKDPEIRDFRRELNDCLTGYLGGTMQADEETFLRIQKLVDKLRDDKNVRWREKVIDVRRWFCFSAQEIHTESGERGSYYDGGSGKSGGEKARLAFLVLVAAIVYQYDINPDDAVSNKFHFVMVDEMFSKTADKYARYALDLFKQFGLQLLMVAPLDAKARVCEPYVGVHAHVVKDAKANASEILSYTREQLQEELAKR